MRTYESARLGLRKDQDCGHELTVTVVTIVSVIFWLGFWSTCFLVLVCSVWENWLANGGVYDEYYLQFAYEPYPDGAGVADEVEDADG